MSRAAFLFTPVALAAAVAPARAQQTATLRIGATPYDTYGEAYYAQEMGFFAKAGLDAGITTFSNGNAIATGVASGDLDIGVTNPVALANAIANEIPFVYFAGGALYDTAVPTTLLCVAKDGPILDAKQLAGKTVGNQTAKDLGTLVLSAFLEERGVDTSSVAVVEIPMSAMGAALRRGTIAGAILSEPMLTAAIAAGEARPIDKLYDAIAPRFYISGWFTTRDWLRRHTDLAKRYAAVIYETARWANRPANHERSGRILANVARLDPSLVHEMRRCRFDTELNPRYLAPPVALAVKAGLTSRQVAVAEMIAR